MRKLAGAIAGLLFSAAAVQAGATPTPLQLDFADDGRQLKLLVRHSAIGLVCELWCYEGGPFRYGTASRTEDGKVVFIHKSRGMTATSTFTPQGAERVLLDIVVEGPLDQLKTVTLMGPCMQLWHAPAFQRRDSLAEFAKRCFIYTMRGPVGMLDTARGPMSSYKREAPENNPPYTQWYVPVGYAHPGDIWGFGASGDRPLYGVVGAVSRDGQWLAAIGCARAKNVGQGWHDCIHHVPQMPAYLDEKASRIVHRTVLYVMPNDKAKLLAGFRRDFPEAEGDRQLRISAGRNGALTVGPRVAGAPSIDVSLAAAESQDRHARWEPLPWGGFARQGSGWRMWANPAGDAVELAVALEGSANRPAVEAALLGKGWVKDDAPGAPAVALRSADGAWTAALLWEKSENGRAERAVPAPGESDAGITSLRGRLYFTRDDADTMRKRWAEAGEDWKHAVPYHMPLRESPRAAAGGGVRFAPNAEEDVTYGLTVVPPWADGGTMHINFPEHLEYGLTGHGILRHSDKRPNPWKIAADGRSASYDVDSLELPGVNVRASAVASGADRARLRLKITNRSGKTLERVKPLLCLWYAKLAGFPGRLSDNFTHTWVVQDGKPVALAAIPTEKADATAKVAYVRGCSQHDCDKFALSRGGLIGSDIDRALIAVTARDGKRKVLLTFTPGKSILSNRAIPCAHADPYLGTLENGQSVEAAGELLFTGQPLEGAIARFVP